MAPAKTQTCSFCGNPQELPAIFCGSCNTPLLKISKIFLLVFLTVTVMAFAYFGMVQEKILFAWPLYSYFALLFVVLSYAVTRRHRLLTLRMVAWSSLLAYGLWFFYLGMGRALTNMTGDIRDIIDIIEQDLFARITMGLVILTEVVLAFVLLKKRFGFANGYRVYVTFVAAGAFAARSAFSYAAGGTGVPVSARLSDWFAWAPETEVKEMFELVAVNIMRAMLAEVAVTSFIKAYRPASEAFQRFTAATAGVPRTGPGAAMLDAASRLNTGLFRAALLFRYFFGQFSHALATYLLALGRTLRRLFLDLLLPIGALFAAALLLGVLTEHTAAYITGRAGERLVYFQGIRSSLAMMGVSLLLLFSMQLVFLAAVTKFPPRALWRCNSLLVMWLAPFVVFLFVFVSLSLIAMGFVANRYEGGAFPYHLGPLTKASGVILVLMIVYAALAARRMGARMAAGETPASGEEILTGQELLPVTGETSVPVETPAGAVDGAVSPEPSPAPIASLPDDPAPEPEPHVPASQPEPAPGT